MTTVHISLGRDDGTDQTAAKGVVEWEPTTRREDGTMVANYESKINANTWSPVVYPAGWQLIT